MLATMLFLAMTFATFDTLFFTSHTSAAAMGDAVGHSTGIFLKNMIRVAVVLFMGYVLVKRRTARK